MTTEEANAILDRNGWEATESMKLDGTKTGFIVGVYDKHNWFHVFGKAKTVEEAVDMAVNKIGVRVLK